jgi:hypothetical protein
MAAVKTPIAAFLAVNGHLLAAFLLGFAAFAIWPQTAQWWQLGVMSVMLAVLAVAKLCAGIRAMTKIFLREREIARLMALGRADRPSELAGTDALRHAGMTHENQ